jgi:hypothetical protein
MNSSMKSYDFDDKIIVILIKYTDIRTMTILNMVSQKYNRLVKCDERYNIIADLKSIYHTLFLNRLWKNMPTLGENIGCIQPRTPNIRISKTDICKSFIKKYGDNYRDIMEFYINVHANVKD